MNGLYKLETAACIGLIMFALVATVKLALSNDQRDGAHDRMSGANRSVRIEDRLWIRYALDSDLAGFNLEIDTRDETVVIGGAVNDAGFRDRAEQIAVEMDGVDGSDQVDNLIVVAEATAAEAG